MGFGGGSVEVKTMLPAPIRKGGLRTTLWTLKPGFALMFPYLNARHRCVQFLEKKGKMASEATAAAVTFGMNVKDGPPKKLTVSKVPYTDRLRRAYNCRCVFVFSSFMN